MGRWRVDENTGGQKWTSGLVSILGPDAAFGPTQPGPFAAGDRAQSEWTMRQVQGVQAAKSDDPDTERIWWSDAGVHQNLTFPVQPDPVSGMHCWHQKVRIEKAHAEDQYGDVQVDVAKSREAYRRWLEMTRPGPGPGGLRRPEFMMRHVTPKRSAYRLPPKVWQPTS
jgi:hypothetical protein